MLTAPVFAVAPCTRALGPGAVFADEQHRRQRCECEPDVDFDQLNERAQRQIDALKPFHAEAAREALRP